MTCLPFEEVGQGAILVRKGGNSDQTHMSFLAVGNA